MGIPTVGIVDTNSDPTKVTYPVPMNDDAAKSLDYALNLMKDAILEGKKPVAVPTVAKAKKKVSRKKKDVKSKS
jgi:ribosomal protein S2